MANPWYDGLVSIAEALGSAPAIVGLPTPQLRELPFVLGSDSPPLCFVCPDRQGKKVRRQTFARDRQASVWWDLPCVVLLIYAANRRVASDLEARLQLDWDVSQRLFVPTLPGNTAVVDVDADPRAAADVGAALGTNYAVGGLGLVLRVPVKRGATVDG